MTTEPCGRGQIPCLAKEARHGAPPAFTKTARCLNRQEVTSENKTWGAPRLAGVARSGDAARNFPMFHEEDLGTGPVLI